MKKMDFYGFINSQTWTPQSIKNQQTLDSSTNFCAAMVMKRKSAWWAITSLTNSLVLSALMFSLFKLDRDLSLSSKVCWALRSQVQNAASSFLEAAAGQLLY